MERRRCARSSSGSGRLTTLVNNAGVLHRASLADETPAGFEGSWRFNCLGPFLGIRATLATSAGGAEGAAIVNTCSTGAIRPFPNHAAYGSSKWALRGLTQAAAAELAPSGIRVNAVFPGPIATPMLDAATQARLAERAPFGRIGEADARSPTRWRFWYPSRRRSSPARNSSSTADRSCRSDDACGQVTLRGDHRRRSRRAGARNLPAQGGLS